MKPLTPQQKKAGWIIGAVLLTVHFAPGVIAAARRSFSPPPPARPLPVRPVAVAPPPPPAPDPAAVALFQATTQFAGIWTGSALDADQNRCSIRLEMRPSLDKPGAFSGYESRSCFPVSVLQGGKIRKDDIPTIIRETSPVSATMTGSVINGAMVFQIDNIVGARPGPCQLTGYSASPFGSGQIMAEWQEGSCPGGHMLLVKARG